MLVDRDYLLKKPSGPSAPKLFLDTRIVPAGVNALGSVEVALSRLAARTGIRPAFILVGAGGILACALLHLADRRAGSRSHNQRASL